MTGKLLVGALVCLAAICVCGASELDAHEEWLAYKAAHGKSYSSKIEDAMRHSIYVKNQQSIRRFNEAGAASYELGLNHLADRTESELRSLLTSAKQLNTSSLLTCGRNNPEGKQYLDMILGQSASSDPLPAEWDWRQTPLRVTEVQDRGQCAADWAFAATGVLEGQQLNATKGAHLFVLSAQEILDCSGLSAPCEGSLPSVALATISLYSGIDTDQDYPYKSKQGGDCLFFRRDMIMTTNGPIVLPVSEQILAKVLVKYGPVSVTLNFPDELHFYKGGVFKKKDCPVFQKADYIFSSLLVGYGTDPKEGDYWLLKNSYGKSWGESGYLRLARNADNMCGIASQAVIAAM